VNAIVDALAPLGVTDMPVPATSERVWRALRAKTEEKMNEKMTEKK
jgi:carbon-monoxide dehydrogenase large subunit